MGDLGKGFVEAAPGEVINKAGLLPHCGMAARGDIQSRGRRWTTCMRKRAIWPALACLASSVLTKVVSLVTEE